MPGLGEGAGELWEPNFPGCSYCSFLNVQRLEMLANRRSVKLQQQQGPAPRRRPLLQRILPGTQAAAAAGGRGVRAPPLLSPGSSLQPSPGPPSRGGSLSWRKPPGPGCPGAFPRWGAGLETQTQALPSSSASRTCVRLARQRGVRCGAHVPRRCQWEGVWHQEPDHRALTDMPSVPRARGLPLWEPGQA